jgi:hypothetical protein
VETRGRTLEETAALFDGADKPDALARMARLARLSREAPVMYIRRLSASDDESDGDIEKVRALESYELRRPQVVLERDRLGHTKGRDMIYPFGERI